MRTKASWFSALLILRPKRATRAPYFFASLKVAVTLAFVGSVVAELGASNRGIGNMMVIASSRFDVPLVFAGLIVVALMGIALYAAFAILERRVVAWAYR